ncbi:MAG: type I-E CRISPR-associated protein Cas5/CasD [Gammaproteobacteria bacterium]|nr:type I-E CRISPR-associated protein Cas5/CasD [Gammaproteobacteria bacterium]HXK57076.1 type I-E CRISPR-associated protein Cas5/CasD [Gammaproteobacteria bacterium]
MKDYLLFQLYGAMASWGDTAVGEFRPSHSHPTRSAVLGLVAAALGIRQHEEEQLQALENSCRVAVRLDWPGEAMRDYHTTQVPPQQRKVRHYTRRDELKADKLHTILSQRDYRTDSAATIALTSKNEPSFKLQQIADKLQRPELPLYLGRKSCPLAFPAQPRIVQAKDLKAAFDTCPLITEQLENFTTDLHRFGQAIAAPDHIRYYWEESETNPGMETQMIYSRRDRLRNRKRWQFDMRSEHYAAKAREE